MIHRNVCCAIDFSETSRLAVDEAAELAAGSGAELTLAHVAGVVPPAATELFVAPGPVLEEAAAELKRALDASRHRAEARLGRPVKAVLLAGDPADEIVRYASSAGVDLLVLGTHGRSGLRRLVLGSVAERVLRHAPCPVLVVRPTAWDELRPSPDEVRQYTSA